MAWYDRFLPTIAALAPNIAGSLGGPIARLGVHAIFAALGVTSEEEAERSLDTLDPDRAERLREADRQFKIAMQAMNIDLERIAAADREAARQRQVALRDPAPAYIAAYLLSIWAIGIGGIIIASASGILNISSEVTTALISAAFGSLLNAKDPAIGFFLGSSSASKEKTETINNLASLARESGDRR